MERKAVPRRIVSLVPSLTELVCWFGLRDRLVGRTRFCIEPPDLGNVAIVGGTKDPDAKVISALAPDVIIANKEENRREDVEALEGAGLHVLLTDPNTVAEALEMVTDLGDLLGVTVKARALVAETEAALQDPASSPQPRVFVAVWRKPLLGLGSESYGHDVVKCAGATNVLADRPRYPEVALDELRELRPDIILLPDEPYRFQARHVGEYAGIAPARVIDGKLLWWYGPRMPAALRQLRALFAETTGRN